MGCFHAGRTKNTYRGFTEAQARAHKKYIARFVEVKIRMDPERRDTIKAHAVAHGESVNGFIGRAISEAMERDGPQEAAGIPGGAGGISLPPDVLGAAQTAAEAMGEAPAAFVARAVQTQVERDKAFLKMGIDPATGNKLKREA